MNTAQTFVTGGALGGGLVYFLDPRRGKRRRALVRDRAIRMAGDIEHTVAVGARDLTHRLRGIVSGSLARAAANEVPNEVLVERVRATLGHACSHPHAVHVRSVGGGLVELTGHILESDLDRVTKRVLRIPGVRAINDDLELCFDLEGIPAPQREAMAARSGTRPQLTPAARAFVLTGAGLAALGMAGRRALQLGAGVFAAGAIARSIAQRRSRAEARAAQRRRHEHETGARTPPPPTAPTQTPPSTL